MMSPGDRFPLLSSLVGADGSGEVPGSVSEVGYLVDFLLGCTGSWVGFEDGVCLVDLCGLLTRRRIPPGVLWGV